MFCNACGSSIPDNARFCAACGTPLTGGGAGPVPPSLHWAAVLLLAIFTGVFGYVWLFIQASFVEKLEPASRIMRTLLYAAITWAVGTVAMIVVALGVPLAAQALANRASAAIILLPVLGAVLIGLVHVVFFIQAVFQMRRVLVRHYNEVEPYGLRLGPVMTFFFNVIYFQYHLTQIAAWKSAGSPPRFAPQPA